MKKICEKCQQAMHDLTTAYICSYECTFCENCAKVLNHICPNCAGGLVKRPTRNAKFAQ